MGEVCEASPVKMVELLAGVVASFKGIKTCTVPVNPEHIKQLVLRSLMGSTAVLTETFTQSEDEAELEIGSVAGTDCSFELAGDVADTSGIPQRSGARRGNGR